MAMRIHACRRRPYRVECTGSLPTSEVKRRRARLVLGWGTAREVLRVLSAFFRPGGAVVWHAIKLAAEKEAPRQVFQTMSGDAMEATCMLAISCRNDAHKGCAQRMLAKDKHKG